MIAASLKLLIPVCARRIARIMVGEKGKPVGTAIFNETDRR